MSPVASWGGMAPSTLKSASDHPRLCSSSVSVLKRSFFVSLFLTEFRVSVRSKADLSQLNLPH